MGYYTIDYNSGKWIKVEDSPLKLGNVDKGSLDKIEDWILEYDAKFWIRICAYSR